MAGGRLGRQHLHSASPGFAKYRRGWGSPGTTSTSSGARRAAATNLLFSEGGTSAHASQVRTGAFPLVSASA